MITLKSAHEIELMRRAGKITAAARALAGEMVKPGVTTHEIDKAVYTLYNKVGHNVGADGFWHSVANEVNHGINRRVL